MSLSSLSSVLAWHCRRYPAMQARDIYKLIHQGVFGPGHIISSAAAAHRALACELAALQVPSPKDKGRMPEPNLEPLDPNNKLVRVNLRPFSRSAEVRSQRSGCRRQKGASDWLAEAMVESAARVKGDPRIMKRRLAAAVSWCRTNLPRQAPELERIAVRAEGSGFPAFHHSSAYAKAYRPAYRVILSDCLERRVSGRAG